MIAKLFSRVMAPWSYFVTGLVLTILLWIGQSFFYPTRFWHLEEMVQLTSLPLSLGIFGISVFTAYLIDSYLLTNLKYEYEYSLWFPAWAICYFSMHLYELNKDYAWSSLFIAVFMGLWIHFQEKESKMSLLAAGLAVGISTAFIPLTSILILFGLSALWIWNTNPLRSSFVWILGCLLPSYYLSTFRWIFNKDWPHTSLAKHSELWLVNLPSYQIPWYLILVLASAVAGILLHLLGLNALSKFHRLLSFQWLWLGLFLVTVFVFFDSDPWAFLALFTPWIAWWVNGFLHWREGRWIQDAFFIVWILLFLWNP